MVGWVRVDGTSYHVVKLSCTRRQLKLFLRHGESNSVHILRFGRPHYSFVLDDSLVTDVSFSTDAKVALIRACRRWYFESRISEKENV